MADANTVVVISNRQELIAQISSKLVLLRNLDKIKSCSIEEAQNMFDGFSPNVLILHCENNNPQALNLIKKIKKQELYKNLPILLINENCSRETIIEAFDCGINDVIFMPIIDYELLIRVIWCLQKNQKSLEIQNKSELLSELKILDDTNNVYTSNYSYNILKEEANKNKGTLALIAPDINIRNKISPDSLVNVIKNSVRSCDIIGFAQDFKIYLWLKNTNKKDALGVLNKIQKNEG